MFLPDLWPAYYEKAKGCEVWDLDGNRYVDMITMGIGACILGYADDDVNNAVKNIIDKGNMSILNAPEEVELAELLCTYALRFEVVGRRTELLAMPSDSDVLARSIHTTLPLNSTTPVDLFGLIKPKGKGGSSLVEED